MAERMVKKRVGASLAAVLSLALLAPAPARPDTAPPAPRAEVPIREVLLSDGVHRYGVEVTVGGKTVLAGIDTGAAGLRLMPDAQTGVQARADRTGETYSFGSGTHLDGVIGHARIGIGGLSGAASIHLVRAVDCIRRAPGCPGTLGLGYGFLGDGLKGEGFRVLLGANMGRTTVDNPLMAAGARRWIISLPRPGETAPGRLILNPTDDEVSGFTLLRLLGGYREEEGGGLHDSVPGCLINEATQIRACGPVALDTGSFSLRVLNARPAMAPWADGTPAALVFENDQHKPAVTVHMTVGRLAQTMSVGTAPRPETLLQPGTAPFFAFDVLYDPGRRMLGFRARPPMADGPRGEGASQ